MIAVPGVVMEEGIVCCMLGAACSLWTLRISRGAIRLAVLGLWRTARGLQLWWACDQDYRIALHLRCLLCRPVRPWPQADGHRPFTGHTPPPLLQPDRDHILPRSWQWHLRR